MQEQVASLGLDVGQEADQIGQAASKTIHAPGHCDLNVTTGDGLQQGIEARTLIPALCSRDAFVGEDVGDGPAGSGGDVVEGLELVFDGLAVGADPCVDCCSLHLQDDLTDRQGVKESRMDQQPPKADRRYRVHRSAKFYIASLAVGTAGGTWSFERSAERVVYWVHGRGEMVTYKNRYHPLRKPKEMERLIRDHLALGGYVTISGLPISLGPDDEQPTFEPYDWIDLSSIADRDRLKQVLAAS